MLSQQRTFPLPDAPTSAVTPRAGRTFLRGLGLRCPNCGKGRLFSGYLKQVNRCANCGEDLSEVRADDMTSWLTILIVGILLAPLVGLVETHTDFPVGLSMVLWCVVALALMLAVLPRAKGFLIAAIWLTRRAGRGD